MPQGIWEERECRGNIRREELSEPAEKLKPFVASKAWVDDGNDNALETANVSHDKHNVVPIIVGVFIDALPQSQRITDSSNKLLIAHMKANGKSRYAAARGFCPVESSLADNKPGYKVVT